MKVSFFGSILIALASFSFVVPFSAVAQSDAETYFDSGYEKYSSGDYTGAIQDYNKAIGIDPNFAMAFVERGMCKQQLQDNRGAIQDYSKAIELDPSIIIDVYYNRGTSKYDVGDYAGAIQDLTKVIKTYPDDFEAYYNRGLAKYELGDLEGACLDWSKAGELGFTEAYDLIRDDCN